MKAINNNVILEKIDNQTTSCGIILTSTNDNTAKVIDISNSLTTELKIGDTVVYKTDKTVSFNNNGKKYFCINIEDILVIL